jgi:hypothetical protein
MVHHNNHVPRATLGTAYRKCCARLMLPPVWRGEVALRSSRARHRGAALTAMQGGNTFNVIGL